MPSTKKRTQPPSSKNNRNTKRRKNAASLTIDSGPRPKHLKLDIKFDPQARRDYLTSLSSKKKERRTFGLAMQKVKDRKQKLEQRREERAARLEQVEEAERNKRIQQFGTADMSSSDEEEEEENERGIVKREKMVVDKAVGETVVTFQDSLTKDQFGGQVVVTTTFGLDSDDDNDENISVQDGDVGSSTERKKNCDEEQKFAGSVQKYMSQLKGNLPSKRQKFQSNRGTIGKKGKHGAEGMKGMGSASDLKLAQKTLDKFRNGKKGRATEAGVRGKNKKGRKRR